MVTQICIERILLAEILQDLSDMLFKAVLCKVLDKAGVLSALHKFLEELIYLFILLVFLALFGSRCLHIFAQEFDLRLLAVAGLPGAVCLLELLLRAGLVLFAGIRIDIARGGSIPSSKHTDVQIVF